MRRTSAALIGVLLLAGCAPGTGTEAPSTAQTARDMGWPCGETIAGLWTAPDGGAHVVVADGVEGYLSEADPATAACLRANGLAL